MAASEEPRYAIARIDHDAELFMTDGLNFSASKCRVWKEKQAKNMLKVARDHFPTSYLVPTVKKKGLHAVTKQEIRERELRRKSIAIDNMIVCKLKTDPPVKTEPVSFPDMIAAWENGEADAPDDDFNEEDSILFLDNSEIRPKTSLRPGELSRQTPKETDLPGEQEITTDSEDVFSQYDTGFLLLVCRFLQQKEEFRDWLKKKVHQEDLLMIDILHAIEFSNEDAPDSEKVVSEIHSSRLRRREAKDLLTGLQHLFPEGQNDTCNPEAAEKYLEGLETRAYRPRANKDLFQNSPVRIHDGNCIVLNQERAMQKTKGTDSKEKLASATQTIPTSKITQYLRLKPSMIQKIHEYMNSVPDSRDTITSMYVYEHALSGNGKPETRLNREISAELDKIPGWERAGNKWSTDYKTTLMTWKRC